MYWMNKWYTMDSSVPIPAQCREHMVRSLHVHIEICATLHTCVYPWAHTMHHSYARVHNAFMPMSENSKENTKWNMLNYFCKCFQVMRVWVHEKARKVIQQQRIDVSSAMAGLPVSSENSPLSYSISELKQNEFLQWKHLDHRVSRKVS
jgi:hypothetical protein